MIGVTLLRETKGHSLLTSYNGGEGNSHVIYVLSMSLMGHLTCPLCLWHDGEANSQGTLYPLELVCTKSS